MSARPARFDWPGRSGLPVLPARPAKLGRRGLAGLARPTCLARPPMPAWPAWPARPPVSKCSGKLKRAPPIPLTTLASSGCFPLFPTHLILSALQVSHLSNCLNSNVRQLSHLLNSPILSHHQFSQLSNSLNFHVFNSPMFSALQQS